MRNALALAAMLTLAQPAMAQVGSISADPLGETKAEIERECGRFVLPLQENIYGAEPATHDGRPALRLTVYGSACDRVGAEGCTVIAVWNGERLETVRKE